MSEFPDNRLRFVTTVARPEGYHVVLTHENPDGGESPNRHMYVSSECSAFIRYILAMDACATFSDSKRIYQYDPKEEAAAEQVAKICEEQGLEYMDIQAVHVVYSDGEKEYRVFLNEAVEDVVNI